ncbi:MAG: tetratricopeptide repeat protein, partial [Planctomycetales bacterium]|nr:tetratricopeptide repeat protein [Planctomycetales bacterium]
RIFQAQTLIDVGKREEAEQIIAQLREEPYFPTPMLRYLEGLVMISQDNWYEAAKVFEEVRPALSADRQFNIRLNLQLAICYLRLEQWNDAVTAAGQVLQAAPGHSMARDLMELARKKIGNSEISDNSASDDINSVVRMEMSKPAAEQDWDKVLSRAEEVADQLLEEGKISPAGKQLLEAEILMRAKRYKEGAKLVRQAIKAEPDNIDTWRLACRLTAADPDGGAVKALRMLDEVVKKFDDRTILRLDRADMYMMLNDEEMIQHVVSVSEGTEDWPAKDQVALWKGLATRLEGMRAMEQLNEARAKIAELAPNELANLVDMFEAARLQHDDAHMKQAQDTILKVVGGKNDVYWLYTEAHRLMSQYERDLVGKEAIEEAKVDINRALEQRPEWHVLHQTLAEIAVAERDPDAALKHLDDAAELGPPTTRSLLQHVTLLMQRGRYDDALKQIERANSSFRLRLMGRQYAEALLRANYSGERDKRWEEAVPTAKEVAALAPENGALQLWLGRFLATAASSSRLAESTREDARKAAGEAFEKACQLMPKSPESWFAYLGYLQINKRAQRAQEIVREMQLELDEDQQLMVLGAGYQVLGRWVDAENVYRQALAENPDSLTVKQSLAAFYLSGAYRLNDKVAKATPLVNDILRTAQDKPELATNENVMWARRTAAKLLAQTGDYQKSLDAARLLRSNIVNGELIVEDKLLLAKLLASRPEPVSRVRAVKLFEEVAALQPLSPADGLVLGQLYFATGDWEAAQRQMRELISGNRDFLQARDAYTRMLLAHDEGRDLNDAARQLRELQKLAPSSPSTLELLVRISSKLGREKDVVPALQKLLQQKNFRNDPDVLTRVAKLLADLDYEDNAEKLFDVASKMDPAKKLDLADFVSLHRDLDRGLDILEEARDDVSEEIAMQYASAILIAAGDKAKDKHFQRVEGWLAKALREDPESIKLVLQKAEILGARKQYSQSVEIYRDLLKREDLTGFNRAVVLNNLAYMLAQSTTDAPSNQEAMKYVNEAAQILGPRSDILDTRAVVHMALGNSDQAVSDLEYAVTDQPTASKYFHLCRAYLLDRQNQKAVGAWRKAVELGLTESSVGTVEREVYHDVEKRIKQLAPDAVATNRAA